METTRRYEVRGINPSTGREEIRLRTNRLLRANAFVERSAWNLRVVDTRPNDCACGELGESECPAHRETR